MKYILCTVNLQSRKCRTRYDSKEVVLMVVNDTWKLDHLS